MVQAMNTGHDGSLSTCHANSPGRRPAAAGDDGSHGRCRPAAPAPCREQLASAIDLVVQVARRPEGRRVVAVAEVVPAGPAPSGRSSSPDRVGWSVSPTRGSRAVGAAAPDPAWLRA